MFFTFFFKGRGKEVLGNRYVVFEKGTRYLWAYDECALMVGEYGKGKGVEDCFVLNERTGSWRRRHWQ